jgi:hypothetical protein
MGNFVEEVLDEGVCRIYFQNLAWPECGDAAARRIENGNEVLFGET